MPRNGANIYSKPAGTTAVSGTTIESAKYNSTIDDLVTDANTPRAVIAGGTGAATLTGLLATLGGQPLDGALTSIAALVYAADQGIHATGIDTFAVHTQTAFARTLLDDTTAAIARTTLGAQAADADLDAVAALATTGLVARTGAGTAAARSITSTDASVTITNPDGVAGNINLAVAYACRAWVNFNGSGVVAIRASGNVSSITDNGVGNYTVNFTTAMSDANYAMTGTCNATTNHPARCVSLVNGGAPAVGSIQVTTGLPGADTVVGRLDDCSFVNIAIFR